MGLETTPNPFAIFTLYAEKEETQTTLAQVYFQIVDDGYAGHSIEFKECLINPKFISSLPNDDVGNGVLRHEYVTRMIYKPGTSFGHRGSNPTGPFGGNIRQSFIDTLTLSIFNPVFEAAAEHIEGTLIADLTLFLEQKSKMRYTQVKPRS